jgi:TolA-binding protein
MKELVLVAIFVIAGCATTNTRSGYLDPRIVQLENKRKELDEREQQCVNDALARSRDTIARMAGTPESSVELQTQKENNERDREISQCHAWADHENAQIAEQERAEYELEAKQEQNRAQFLSIVTAPMPRPGN